MLNRSHIGLAVLNALFASSLLGGLVTFLDWQKNPGDIFRPGGVTDWSIVWETWLSWFVPAFFLVLVLSLTILAIYIRRAMKRE